VAMRVRMLAGHVFRSSGVEVDAVSLQVVEGFAVEAPLAGAGLALAGLPDLQRLALTSRRSGVRGSRGGLAVLFHGTSLPTHHEG
jgi:hypothetical protein